MAHLFQNEAIPDDPKKEGFSWKNPGRYGIPGWVEGETPIPPVLNQGGSNLCIAYSSKNVIQAGFNKAAKSMGLDAPNISLDQLKDLLLKFPASSQQRNLFRFLNSLLNTDLVDEKDYNRQTHSARVGAATYRIARWVELDPKSRDFNNKMKRAILHCGAVVGELETKWEGIGHAVSFVGWNYNPCFRHGKRLAWEYQNSYGPNWGNQGFRTCYNRRIHWAYVLFIEHWA